MNAVAIKKINGQWLDAVVKEDSLSLANILADDFILINPGSQRRTKTNNISIHVNGQQIARVVIDSQDLRFLTNEVVIITVWTTNEFSTSLMYGHFHLQPISLTWGRGDISFALEHTKTCFDVSDSDACGVFILFCSDAVIINLHFKNPT
jgi:hypothetical protein